jgi:glycosyltransferase involved in cell wall biosynthesis
VSIVLCLAEGAGRLRNNCRQDLDCINKNQSCNPLVTIVTVVFNGEQFIEKTILSVINQTYTNIEYIVIDGGSTDGTLGVIRKYEDNIDYWVSEKDEGIYHAMNKGIDRATGEWINFMNVGDWFFADSVLFSVFHDKNYRNSQIIYGSHEVRYHSGMQRIAKYGQVKNLWKGSQFCHQAVFVKSQYHKLNKFNSQNKIVADFEFFYSASKNNASFIQVGDVIASFAAGGVSDVKRINSILGFWRVVDKSLVINLFYLQYLLKEILKLVIKKVIQ